MSEEKRTIKRYTFTKDELKAAGIQLIADNNEVGGWAVFQNRTDCKKTWRTRRPIIDLVTKHPYGKDKYYPGVCIYFNGKPLNTTLHKLVWVWHYGNYPDNYDIDHIDNDPYNCQLDNLRIVSHAENIKKRPLGGCNQYKNALTTHKEMTDYLEDK